MKNERKRLILLWFSFYSLFGHWKILNIIRQIINIVMTAACMLSITKQTFLHIFNS